MRAWIGILLLGATLRLLPLLDAAPENLPRFRGGADSYYHFRRAGLAAEGKDIHFDAWTNYPIGDQVGWPEGYDRALGWVLSIFGIRGIQFAPVLIGIASIVLFALWSRRLLEAAAAMPVVLFAVLPPPTLLTSFSAIDHHGFEVLLFILTLLGVSFGAKRGILLSVCAAAVAYLTVPAWPVPALVAMVGYGIRRGTSVFSLNVAALAAVTLPLVGIDVIFHPHLRTVTEMFPLHRYMMAQGGWLFPILQVSAGILILPWAMLRWWHRRRSDPAAAAALAAGLVALPLSLFAIRFLVYLSVPAALSAGEAYAATRRNGFPRTALGLACLICLAPLAVTSGAELTPMTPQARITEAAIMNLRTLTPPAGDPMDPLRRPAYGVLAPWDIGFHIVVLGERPAISAPIWWNGTPRAPVGEILFADPARGGTLADLIGARILLLDPHMWIGGFPERNWPRNGPAVPEALASRLYLFGDTTIGWRRIFGSEEKILFYDRSVPVVQIWEREPSP